MNATPDYKLVVYILPEQLPLDEAVMARYKERVAFLSNILFWLIIILPVLCFVSWFTYGFGSSASLAPTLVCIFLSMCAIVGSVFVTALEEKYEKQLLYFYQEVQQGKVLGRDILNGKHYVLIEGNNRLNQLRTYSALVNAGDWYDGAYVKDRYVDLPKTSTD